MTTPLGVPCCAASTIPSALTEIRERRILTVSAGVSRERGDLGRFDHDRPGDMAGNGITPGAVLADLGTVREECERKEKKSSRRMLIEGLVEGEENRERKAKKTSTRRNPDRGDRNCDRPANSRGPGERSEVFQLSSGDVSKWSSLSRTSRTQNRTQNGNCLLSQITAR